MLYSCCHPHRLLSALQKTTRLSSHLVLSVPCLSNMAISTPLKRDASHLSGPAVDNKKPKANGSITSFFGVPKPKADAAASTPSSKFNKEKWVASLTEEQKDLLKLEIETLHESWLAHLKDEIVTPEFLSLKRFLKKEKESGVTIFPPESEIYSWYSNHFSSSRVDGQVLTLQGLDTRRSILSRR